MGKTSIEWTDASWNPIVGCTEISPGCANCYASRLSATRLRNHQSYKGLAEINRPQVNAQDPTQKSQCHDPRWTGEVRFLPERLEEPLRWKKPRRIFVCDMGDLFHADVNPEWILKVWGVMASCPQHTFQILTKRADQMKMLVSHVMNEITKHAIGSMNAPLQNVWLGVSVESQLWADKRIPLLLDTPAAVRWISAEPLLGPVGLWKGLDWVVCGGESGPNARPMRPDWAGSLRDQCQAAGVPFFFKQWGTWFPNGQDRDGGRIFGRGQYPITNIGDQLFVKMGKHKAGRLLDGREWNEFPGFKKWSLGKVV